MNWWKNLKGTVRTQEPLRKHTTFKIGGRAKFFIEPKDISDLKLLLTSAKKYKIPIFVIGMGSNVLISDKGLKAIVVHLDSPYFKKASCKRNSLEVGVGLKLRQLVQTARMRSLSGVEFLTGIPGTVGGALVMNAGAWGKNIGDLVVKTSVMDYNGNIKTLSKKDIKFEYRSSSLKKYIILSARLKLAKKNKEEIKENIKKYLKLRFNSQDNSLPNAGCIFRNPSGTLAGMLIDQCGLKGEKEGGACVSRKHANFILNRKDARAGDVLKLMDLIKRRVRNRFNVVLEPEIKIWQ